MNRHQYIQLRQKGEVYPIMYYYFREHGGLAISYKDFVNILNRWLEMIFQESITRGQLISKQNLLSSIAEQCIRHYDVKFEIVIITVETEIKKKVITHYIL